MSNAQTTRSPATMTSCRTLVVAIEDAVFARRRWPRAGTLAQGAGRPGIPHRCEREGHER